MGLQCKQWYGCYWQWDPQSGSCGAEYGEGNQLLAVEQEGLEVFLKVVGKDKGRDVVESKLEAWIIACTLVMYN